MYVMYIHIYEYIYVITITCHVTEIEWRSTVCILINCHDFLSNKMHSHQNNYTLYLNSQHPRYLIDHYITSIIFLWPYISRISYILIAHKLKYKPLSHFRFDQKLQRKENSTTRHSLGVLSPRFQIRIHKYCFRHIFVSVHGQASPPYFISWINDPFFWAHWHVQELLECGSTSVTLSYYIAPTLITSVSGHSILHRDNFYLFTPELAPSIIFVQVGPPFLFFVGVHENNKHI